MIDITKLSPAEVDELIAKLAEHKAKTAPCSTDQPPEGLDAVIDPMWRIWSNDRGSLLCFRHSGLGWVGFDIPHAERSALLAALLNGALIRPATAPTSSTVPTPTTASGSGNKILH